MVAMREIVEHGRRMACCEQQPVTVPPIKPAPSVTRIFIKLFSQAFFMDTINDPISIHMITAVYWATGLTARASECVGDSIRDTEAAQ
jgi:hypothetical protein